MQPFCFAPTRETCEERCRKFGVVEAKIGGGGGGEVYTPEPDVTSVKPTIRPQTHSQPFVFISVCVKNKLAGKTIRLPEHLLGLLL